MQGNEWVYVAIAALLGAHAVMLVYAYRSQGSETSLSRFSEGPDRSEPASPTNDESSDEGYCRCPNCGAENDTTYRFCRECIAELPAAQLQIDHPSKQQQPY